MRAGVIAGSIAAVIVAVISLPLRSPEDLVFNSLTVVIGALFVGLVAGALWRTLATVSNPLLYLAVSLGAGFALVAGLAVLGETQLDRVISFAVPLAAITFVLIGVLVPTLARAPLLRWWWSTPAAVVIALGLGFGLVAQGDEESGELSLPSRTTGSSPLIASEVGAPASTSVPPSSASAASRAPTPAPTSPASPGAAAGASVVERSQVEGATFVVAEGSEATFTVTEQLVRFLVPNDAVVRTSALSGEIHLDGRQSVIDIDLHRLSSDQAIRDRYIRGRMFPNDQVATFTLGDIGPIPEGFFTGEIVTRDVAGTLAIRGVEVPLTFNIEARNDGDVLYILGSTTFTWDQLEIMVPTARPVVYVNDEVRVEVLLLVRPQTGGSG